MARVTATTSKLFEELGAAGAWSLSIGQLQLAVEADLGPRYDAPDPVDHWRTLTGLAVQKKGNAPRLPTSDRAAVDLAIAGYSCHRLATAIRRMIATSDPPRDPDDVAEEIMTAAQTPGDDSYGARLAERMLTGATARPGIRGENAQLERLGQAQAVATSFSEVAEGDSVQAIDADDVAQVFGMPPELVRAFLPALEAVFGSHDVLSCVDALVDDASSTELVAAVRGAAGLVPLFEDRVVVLDTISARTQWIAQVTPMLLVVKDLLGAVNAHLGGPERAAAIPSMFDPQSPSLRQAQESLRPLLPRAELPHSDAPERQIDP